jgi:hypothetical protein
MRYIKKLIDFDQWGELNNSGWYNMELNERIGYYINKYPIGTKVRIKKDSEYYKEDTKDNPRYIIGEINRINPDGLDLQSYVDDNYIFNVIWTPDHENIYRVFDLEYLKDSLLGKKLPFN